MQKENVKVAVGLSGGVDSSVTAALLKEQGYDVVGVHMLTYDADMPGCSGSMDRADALLVAKQLDIPFRVVDVRQYYQDTVIERFVAEYQAGRTPNPDIWCNEEIKFGVFMEYAFGELGVDKIATGHYARVAESEDGFQLLSGVDRTKDQSYFLYRITQEQLSKTLFPLGEYMKEQVREFAGKFDLLTAEKPDSVGICFIGDIDVKEFLKDRITFEPGEVVTVDGNVIGHHDGVQFYTIGQRHGFTLTAYQGRPLFVVEKDVKKNRLVVGRDEDSDVNQIEIGSYHQTTNQNTPSETNLKVRIRHLGELYETEVRWDKSTVSCTLAEPIRGVAIGQHAVLYDDVVVVGGGVIEGVC